MLALTSPSCRNFFAAIRTPPCGSPGLSLLCISYSSEPGIISDEAILLSSHVSVPIIMSGSTSSMTVSSSFPFLLRLWKLIFKTLRFLTFAFGRLSFCSLIYDKRDDFDFEIVNFPFLDGDVYRSTSFGVYISQLIRFARVCSHVADFNTRNELLTQRLLEQGYRFHNCKTFSKFYRRYYDLISKFQVGLKSLLCQGLPEPEFYGDLVNKLNKIVGSNNFSAQFIKTVTHYKKLARTLMYGNRLHDWWSNHLLLVTLLSSLIALPWVGLQTL